MRLSWYVFKHVDGRIRPVPLHGDPAAAAYERRHSAKKLAEFGTQAMADADVRRREALARKATS